MAVAVGLFLLAGGYFALTSFNNASKLNLSTNTENTVPTNQTIQASPEGAATESGMTESAQEVKVDITGFKFAPATLTVKKGTKVTWTSQDSVKHNASSSDNEGFKGPLLAKGESYSYTFNQVGTYNYICDPHPFMKGSVTVTE